DPAGGVGQAAVALATVAAEARGVGRTTGATPSGERGAAVKAVPAIVTGELQRATRVDQIGVRDVVQLGKLRDRGPVPARQRAEGVAPPDVVHRHPGSPVEERLMSLSTTGRESCPERGDAPHAVAIR